MLTREVKTLAGKNVREEGNPPRIPLQEKRKGPRGKRRTLFRYKEKKSTRSKSSLKKDGWKSSEKKGEKREILSAAEGRGEKIQEMTYGAERDYSWKTKGSDEKTERWKE